MQGYYNRPDAKAESLRDGWLHTGDVGYRDADGFFFLVDRKKDMIIRGGENIYPREIEDVLLEHDGVQGAAVVGRPDEVRGEEVHAVVVLAPDAELETVRAHCARTAREVQGAVELGGRGRPAQDLDGQDRQEATARAPHGRRGDLREDTTHGNPG